MAIFARHPQRGRVKTRLVPPLTSEEALELHTACLKSTAHLAASLPPWVDKWLYLTSGHTAAARRLTRALDLPRRLKVRVQGGGTLGRRLTRAFGELLAAGYERVVVIGSDSPTLPRSRLLQALSALTGADAVIGPARDGGYYLIGLRTPRTGLSRLFRGIEWGTPRAYRQTRTRLRAVGCRVRTLASGYDIDRAADLARLHRALRRSRHLHLKPLRTWFAQQRPAPRGRRRGPRPG